MREGRTYTVASLGHSAEVQDHVIGFLTEMVPSNYSRQQCQPTSITQATEHKGEGMSGVGRWPMSLCVCVYRSLRMSIGWTVCTCCVYGREVWGFPLCDCVCML